MLVKHSRFGGNLTQHQSQDCKEERNFLRKHRETLRKELISETHKTRRMGKKCWPGGKMCGREGGEGEGGGGLGAGGWPRACKTTVALNLSDSLCQAGIE